MSLHAALRNIGRVRVCTRQCARTKCRGLWREGETDVPDSVTPTVGLFLFFSLAPSSVLLLLPPLSLVLPSLSSLSLGPSVITAQSPGFYRRSDVATGSGGFRSDVGTIEKSIRISLDVDAVARVAPFLRFLFFDLLSCHRMIDDGFTVSYVTGSDKCTRTRARSNAELTY